jgi:hypothetical protein
VSTSRPFFPQRGGGPWMDFRAIRDELQQHVSILSTVCQQSRQRVESRNILSTICQQQLRDPHTAGSKQLVVEHKGNAIRAVFFLEVLCLFLVG